MESSPNTAWTVGTDGQGEDGISGWKVTKRPHHREGGLGFLLKAAQDKSAATLMGGRMRVLIRYQERFDTEDEGWAFPLN